MRFIFLYLLFVFINSFTIKKKVAIIGGNGYIGSRIIKDLHPIYHIVSFDKQSVINEKNTFIIKSNNIALNLIQYFDVIIYLAGYTGRKICDKFPENVYNENVEDVLHFIKKMRENQTLIIASTSAIMEGSGMIKMNENGIVNENILDRYSMSMYQREKSLKNYSINNKYSPKIIVLRFGTVIGHSPGQRTDMLYMTLIKSAVENKIINVTDSLSWRAILGINDLVRAVSKLIDNPLKNKNRFVVYNLNSFNTQIITVANLIYNKMIIYFKNSSDKNNLQLIINKNNITSGFSLSSTKFEREYDFQFKETSLSLINELVEFLPSAIIAKGVHRVTNSRIIHKKNSIRIPCPICGHHHSEEVLNLHDQPLANNFVNNTSESLNMERYPLKLMTCPKCHHMFLSTMIDRSKLFVKYLYESGTSKTLLDYFEWLAYKINNKYTDSSQPRHSRNVLEIACNDGSQLDVFRKIGWNTYCVDPAKNIIKTAENKGHKVSVGFWGVDTFPELKNTNFDVILAQNVLAHVMDPIAFLKACRNVMGVNTLLYIQTSQCQMHQEGQFDTAYHEHISFFTGLSFYEASKKSGLKIIDFEITPIHGESCLVTFMRSDIDNTNTISNTLQTRMIKEVDDGITTKSFYLKYKENAYNRRQLIINYLLKYKYEGYTLAAYGAAAKGMVLMHFLLNNNSNINIDFVFDDAILKQNTFCPGTLIPVRPTRFLETLDNKPLLIIVFAWNFWEEISKKIKKYIKNNNVVILLPFPTVRVFLLNDA